MLVVEREPIYSNHPKCGRVAIGSDEFLTEWTQLNKTTDGVKNPLVTKWKDFSLFFFSQK